MCSQQRGAPKGALGLAGGRPEHPCWCAWRYSGAAHCGQATLAGYSAREASPEVPCNVPNLTRLITNETKQERGVFGAAEHSDEVG